ncbi:MAG: ABC transporter permease [Spirochaetaceae bacterium]
MNDTTAPRRFSREGLSNQLRSLLQARELFLVLIIVVGGVVMSYASPIFLRPGNLKAILLGLSVEATIAAGMTVLLVSGGLDMSVGSTMAFSGVVVTMLMKGGVPVLPAVLLGLLSGALVGLINGSIVATWKVNPFIVTLGMLSIVRGFVLLLAQGVTIIDLPVAFTMIGQGEIFGIQYPIVFTILLVLLGDTFLRRSRFFRQSYYIGGNEKAAVMTGIKVNRVKIINYVITGLLAAVAGIFFTARLAAASVTIGVGLELKVITAAVIGGASLSGGEGTIAGAFLGSILMATLINSLNLLGIDVYWQNVFTGLILVFAVVLDKVLKQRRAEAA